MMLTSSIQWDDQRKQEEKGIQHKKHLYKNDNEPKKKEEQNKETMCRTSRANLLRTIWALKSFPLKIMKTQAKVILTKLDSTHLNNSQSNSVQHDISAVLLYNLNLLIENAKQVHTCWCPKSPILTFLWWVLVVSFKNVCVPFLGIHTGLEKYQWRSVSAPSKLWV